MQQLAGELLTVLASFQVSTCELLLSHLVKMHLLSEDSSLLYFILGSQVVHPTLNNYLLLLSTCYKNIYKNKN